MLVRSALLYSPAVLAPRLAAFVVLLLGARLLSPAEYGLLVLTITLGELLELSLWVRIALVRLGAAERGISAAAMMRASVLAGVSTAAGVVLAFACGMVVAPERALEFSCGLALYVGSSSVLRFSLALMQLQERQFAYGLTELSRALGITIASLLAMVSSDNYVWAALASSATTLAAGLVALRLLEAPPSRAADPRFGELASFAAPLLSVSVLSYVALTIDRLALNSFHGSAAVGLYGATYAIGRQGIDVLANCINLGAFPQFVSAYSEEGQEGAGKALSSQVAILLALTVPAGATLIALQSVVLPTVLPQPYAEAGSTILPWIVFGSICLVLKSYVFDNIFHVVQRSWLQAGSDAVAALVTLATAVIAIPNAGPLGAGIAFASGAAAGLTVSAGVGRRLIPFPLPWYAGAKIAVLAGLSSVGALGAVALCNGPLPLKLLSGAIGASATIVICGGLLMRPWRRGLL